VDCEVGRLSPGSPTGGGGGGVCDAVEWMSRRAVDIAPSRVGDFDDADGGAELMEPAVVIAAGTFGVLSGFVFEHSRPGNESWT
jgi:hypothetical protein